MTFEEIQQEIDQLSLQERLKLWQTCPAPHRSESLLVLNTNLNPGLLRYCPRCFVVFTEDGRAINAPGRRHER